MFQHIHDRQISASKKQRSFGSHPTSEDQKHPIADQLWSVIEFSRQFPELTLSLVAELKYTEQASRRIQPAEPVEELEFPSLIAHDFKELRTQNLKREDEDQLAEQIALFAAGELPPPESKASSVPVNLRQKGKIQFWRYLLTFFALLLLLLWLHNDRPFLLAPQIELTVSSVKQAKE